MPDHPEKYHHKYRISSIRLQNWDYGSPGLYFITICTHNRIHYFLETQNIASLQDDSEKPSSTLKTQNIASLQDDSEKPSSTLKTQNIASLTTIRRIAHQYWSEIPKHFPFVELDEFIIMPDHMHGVIFINKPDYFQWKTNIFGVQSQNLASIIRGYKAAVKKFAVMNNLSFQWQSRYYEHIVRSSNELKNINQYILNNPANWRNVMNKQVGLMM
jgi:putative transposase